MSKILSLFGFEGGILVLIASVPDQCIFFLLPLLCYSVKCNEHSRDRYSFFIVLTRSVFLIWNAILLMIMLYCSELLAIKNYLSILNQFANAKTRQTVLLCLLKLCVEK